MTDVLRDEFGTAQLSMLAPSCKERGCGEPVVGSSITDEGHVCQRHNELEWGRALSRSDQGWLRDMGAALLLEGRNDMR